MTKARNYFAWQSQLVLREIGQRVIEVGCGVGNFTGLLADRAAVFALDKEPGCIERLSERHRNQLNLQTFVCDLHDAEFMQFGRFQPDSCLCMNVLEHTKDNRDALARMASILVPGGVIVLILPAFACLYGQIDANLGHLRRYRRRDIEALAPAAGLRIHKMHYMNLVGFFGWWVNARILHLQAQSEFQIAIFDRLIVPIASRIEARVNPPIGQSLFVVLKKI